MAWVLLLVLLIPNLCWSGSTSTPTRTKTPTLTPTPTQTGTITTTSTITPTFTLTYTPTPSTIPTVPTARPTLNPSPVNQEYKIWAGRAASGAFRSNILGITYEFSTIPNTIGETINGIYQPFSEGDLIRSTTTVYHLAREWPDYNLKWVEGIPALYGSLVYSWLYTREGVFGNVETSSPFEEVYTSVDLFNIEAAKVWMLYPERYRLYASKASDSQPVDSVVPDFEISTALQGYWIYQLFSTQESRRSTLTASYRTGESQIRFVFSEPPGLGNYQCNFIKAWGNSLIGDGTSSVITITHNQGTREILTQVFEESTGQYIQCRITHDSPDLFKLHFSVPPSLNQYHVVWCGVGNLPQATPTPHNYWGNIVEDRGNYIQPGSAPDTLNVKDGTLTQVAIEGNSIQINFIGTPNPTPYPDVFLWRIGYASQDQRSIEGPIYIQGATLPNIRFGSQTGLKIDLWGSAGMYTWGVDSGILGATTAGKFNVYRYGKTNGTPNFSIDDVNGTVLDTPLSLGISAKHDVTNVSVAFMNSLVLTPQTFTSIAEVTSHFQYNGQIFFCPNLVLP